jgi:energy-converting hydrogenase B subunit H
LIQPGISLIYNAVGTQLAPNMVTLVVFDWRGFDTLGESLILVTAVLVVLLVFGKGKILDKNINSDSLVVDEGDDE